MTNASVPERRYELDAMGFLRDPSDWVEEFASWMAPRVGLERGLTSEHWAVLFAIRQVYEETGRWPLVYQACRLTGLNLAGMRALFPTGYLRGACRLAGFSTLGGRVGALWARASLTEIGASFADRTYRVDSAGFLADPCDWDEGFATMKAHEMKMCDRLTDRHWQVIRYLRRAWERDRNVPTVYRTCEDNQMDLDELEALFPDGYHRGAVKVAGLCVV
jgi:tRNA 2-thiouridine synthesizing protein E